MTFSVYKRDVKAYTFTTNGTNTFEYQTISLSSSLKTRSKRHDINTV